jgi:hypothetical protein
MEAIIVASSLALLSLVLPPVSIVSSAAVALVTLRRGGYEGLYVLIASYALAAILGLVIFGSFQFALLYGPLIWLIAMILREVKQLSIAVEITVMFGVAGIVVFFIFVNDPAAMWGSILTQMTQPVLENSDVDFPVEKIKQNIQFFSHFMTGGVAAGSVYGLLFGLFLARWWQSVLYNPGGFREEYLSLKVRPKLAIASIVIAAIAWLMSGVLSEICWNITILFVVLYTIVGTAILHIAFSTMKTRFFMVPFLYLTLVFVPHMTIVVVIVGIIDTWLDLRSKFLNKTRT